MLDLMQFKNGKLPPNMSKGHKSSIKKSLKSNLVLKYIPLKVFQCFYSQFTPVPHTDAKYKSLEPYEILGAYIPLPDNRQRLVSAILVQLKGDTAYYALSATLPEYKHLCPNHFLLYQFIVGAPPYVKYFDFGDMTPSQDPKIDSINKFKRHWGHMSECPE